MLTKCARPECKTQLHYLREGRIYRVETPSLTGNGGRVIEHFWLCGECAPGYILETDAHGRVHVTPKRPRANLIAFPRAAGL